MSKTQKFFLSIFIFSASIGHLFAESVWQELGAEDISFVYGNLAWKSDNLIGVRRTLFYTPEKVEAKQPIALIAVHGTFSADSIEYYDNASHFFPALKRYASYLAEKEKAPIKILFYRWSGYDNHTHRCEAGKLLAKVISKHAGYKIITVAHSHGGNVVNYASNLIRNKIDRMIYFAVPVIHLYDIYKPNNFNILYNFYSPNDLIQLLGATDAHKAFTGFMSLWRKPTEVFRSYCVNTVGKSAGKVINISTHINGQEADHSAIKNVIGQFPSVAAVIEKKYLNHDHFFLNIDMRHHVPEQQIIVGLKNPKKEFEDEYTYSEEQKNLYQKLYGRDITAFRPKFAFLYHTMLNTLVLMPKFRLFGQKFSVNTIVPVNA